LHLIFLVITPLAKHLAQSLPLKTKSIFHYVFKTHHICCITEIKIECEDQYIQYKRSLKNIKGCGYFFPFPVPSDEVMCSMKLSAMLSRQKGRDFYDAIFLLSQIKPDYESLTQKNGIHNLEELKGATEKILKKVDLEVKKKDFDHLLFNKKNSERILLVNEFIQDL